MLPKRARVWRGFGGVARTSRPSLSRGAAAHQAGMEIALEALNIGRDSKALLVTQAGRIVHVNEMMSKLCGRAPDELIGEQIFPAVLERAPPDSQTDLCRWESSLVTGSDGSIDVEIVRQPLASRLPGLDVYAIRDLTERRNIAAEAARHRQILLRRDEELRAQNLRFEMALTSLSLGVCVFDAEERLVICNEPYVRMYAFSREHVRPGITLQEILQQRIEQRLYPGSSAQTFISERLDMVAARVPATVTHRLPDGRIVEVGHHPIPGGGWVATHEDVTDKRRIETELEQSNRELAHQNSRMLRQEEELRTQNAKLDAALSNMFQGLAMFDADQRVVIANERFADMYGLRPDQVKPGTPLRTIVEHRIASGLYVGTSVDEVLDRMRERVARQKVSHMTSQMGDGRTIAVSIWPRPDGGWVTTHHDITDREKLNDRLEQQNQLLKQREAELALQNARFSTAINNMAQGLCLFDADQRVVVANRQFAELYGLTPEQAKPGRTLEAILEARAATGLYANIDVSKFVREGVENFGQKVSQIVRLADGRAISVVRLPMPDGSLTSTHEDITERERLNARVAQQHVQLDAALENMLQGVAMFDAQQGLVVCNTRYAEMYGLTLEQLKPGTTVREILEHRLASGNYHVSDKEDFVNSWTDSFGEVSSRIQELADGRIINVTRRSMANGGRLVTHEDITERQKLNAQLQQQHHLLKEHEERLSQQNVRLDAALSNMVQGLAMFDADHRIVVANDRFAELYGLGSREVRPGTTLRQVLEHRIGKGYCPGKDADSLLRSTLDRMSATASTHYVTQLNDGRYIAVSTQSMADGGTVTTHHDITEQRRTEAKIAHMALHDALTGLPNRTLLNERIEHAIARNKRGEIVATHLLDLDHFKTVNDTFGHPTGDKLLQMVADRLRGQVREADTVARMGGDEFAVVQAAISEPSEATSLAIRLIEAISAPYEIDGHQIVIGLSDGIAIGPLDGDRPEQLMRNADLALYRAKGDGRGTFHFFEREMDAQMQERHVLERDLRIAMLAGQFELYYQPVVDLARNEINAFEALIRWHHPERGLLLPETFIPLAEEIGLIIPISEWVLQEACSTAARWPDHLSIAVNLSPVQFRSPGLLQLVVRSLASPGLAPERLELEITETVLLQDGEATLNLLYKLRELGVRIAMDDFGTGYSSLSYLQSFPFDKIKIDRSFVKDIAESTGSLNIVRAISALANGLGMASTAEGVETKEQFDAIRSEGCTEMQGFWFSHPLPADEIERLFICKKPADNVVAFAR